MDDLTAPLGQNPTTKRRFVVSLGIVQVVAGVLGLLLAVFAAWALIADDPLGGEPTVVVPANLRAETGSKMPEEPGGSAAGDRAGPNRYDGPPGGPGAPASPGEPASPTAPAGSRTVTIIDGSSGKRQQVVIPGGPEERAKSEERVTEPSRHGPLPKIAQDGARPADVFARPVKAGQPDAPKVAIVVGGLGIGSTATADALKKLPGPVSLAFMPYGGDLERQVSRARADGHEVLLQVPMEPYDYPDNDPGPHTLLTSLDPGQNVERLHWLMARMQGYVGIANFMGTRFSASEQALTPVLREAAQRGLIYFDDGSSPRSLASQIAGSSGLGFAKADVTIDAVPTGADIDRALTRLEAMARERGIAIGMAGALPVSIERIAKWAKAAEGRGVLLVPVTAVAAKPRSS